MNGIDGPRRESQSGTTGSLVIFLHGYGADGNDLIGLAGPLGGVLADTAFVSPHAPEACRAAPMGRQWFPIPYIDGSSEAEMTESSLKSVDLLNAFLDAEMARTGLPADRVALIGFSQGTMMSLHVGPRRTERLAGIVGFSGRLIEPQRLAAEASSKPPVLLVHGDADEIVPPSSLGEAAQALEAAGFEVQAGMRPGLGHSIDERGLVAAAEFLVARLGGGEGAPE